MTNRQLGAHGAPGKNPGLYQVNDFSSERVDEESDGRFGRMFVIGEGKTEDGTEKLQPNPLPRYELRRLGAKGGPLEPKHGPSVSKRNSLAPAGITFLGQFIDHDITLDVQSKFSSPQINAALENARTPNLDLDCVYGGGREASPYLYQTDGEGWESAKIIEGDKFVGAGTGSGRNDLQRNSAGRAIIGDPRNDENIFVAQVQSAVIRFHNKCVDYLHDNGLEDSEELFEKARDTTTHYYHRVILEDFLYRVIGLDMLQAIATQGRHYYFPNGFDGAKGWPERPFMPVEFSVAAYRYGHSTVRDAYVVNEGSGNKKLFDEELRGFHAIPAAQLCDWDWFFVAQDKTAEQFAHKIDPFLPDPLFQLPEFAGGERSLASRNLMRGRIFRLPSGESIAKRMIEDGVHIAYGQAMTEDDMIGPDTKAPKEIKDLQKKLSGEYALPETPLWLYILMEAATYGKGFASKDLQEDHEKQSKGGDRLGPVGGRIVGEVLMGLLDHYRDATGKGLDYDPDVPSEGDGVKLAGMKFGPRMSMRAMIDFAYS